MSQHRSPYVIPVRSVRYQVCYSKKAQKAGRKCGMLISFDYAIKFFLKNKSDFYVVENFLSALLDLVGYPKIKIIAVNDPENQKSVATKKVTIPDLFVQDEKGNHYLIEIERAHFSDAVYKAHYNTSYSTINDFLKEGDPFSKIKKVIHISILYKPYGNVRDYLYHGKIEPRGINTKHKLAIQKNKEGKKHNTLQDLPEYFFVFPDHFHETFKHKFDEWMNLLKGQGIRREALDKFKDLEKIEKRLNYLNLTEDEKRELDKIRSDLARDKVKLEDAEEKGRKEGRIEVAKNLLRDRMPLDQIAQLTQLTLDEVSSLAKVVDLVHELKS